MSIKYFVATIAISMLIIPTAFAITPQNAEEIIAGDAAVVVDFSVTGKIKDIVKKYSDNFIGSLLSPTGDKEKEAKQAQALLDQILSGERVYVAYNIPDTLLLVMKVTDEQWKLFTEDVENEEYKGYTVYKDASASFVRLGEFLVSADSKDATDSLKPLIDRVIAGSQDSLAQNLQYQKLVSSFLTNRDVGISINLSRIESLLIDQIPNEKAPGSTLDTHTMIKNIFNLFSYEGLSVAQTPHGYGFSMKVLADESMMNTHGLSLRVVNDFIPKLYKIMPSGSPLLYVEGYNLKAHQSLNNAIFEKLFGVNVNSAYKKAYGIFTETTGVSIDEVLGLMTKEYGISVQENNNSVIPVITFMADVSDTRGQAEVIIKKLIAALQKKLNGKEDTASVVVNPSGTSAIVTLTMDKAVVPDKKILITIGISDDNMLVISNFPTILDHSTRMGFENNADFMSYSEIKTPVQSVAYFNARSVWKWVDLVHETQLSKDPDSFPSFNSQQDYYAALKILYTWKDMLMVSYASNTDTTLKGWLTLDNMTHVSFDQYITGLKQTDRDGDGISDYDELYIYKTAPGDADCNDDGILDIDAAKAGFDPCKTAAPVFKDFSREYLHAPANEEKPYYFDEVVMLKKTGVINGYPNGTFGADKKVTRAEFSQMIVKAFQGAGYSFTTYTTAPFADVAEEMWYYYPIEQAYNAGFIAGAYDAEGRLLFRPNEPITRAEGLMILNRASSTLSKQLESTTCTNAEPFNDVNRDDWYCSAVTNGKNFNVTSGRTVKQFAPDAHLSRAEAAVMIRRAMELDLQNASTQTGGDSFGNLLNPLAW